MLCEYSSAAPSSAVAIGVVVAIAVAADGFTCEAPVALGIGVVAMRDVGRQGSPVVSD